MSTRSLMAITLAAVIAATPAHTAAAQSPCAALGGTLDADQVCQVHTRAAGYTIDIAVPLDYPDQQAVVEAVAGERAEFLDWCATYGPDGRDRPYLLDISAQTYGSGSGTRSLVLQTDDDTGLANQGHPDTTFTAFNHDLDNGAPITFGTLFVPGADPLAVLNPLVRRQFGNRAGIPLGDLDAHTYRNFAITDDAVTFFFGQDDVIPDHAGPHQLVVPREQLAGLLTI